MTSIDEPDESRRSTRRARVRYAFDNLLARGTGAVLLWLGVVTLLTVVLSGLALAIFGVSYTDDQNSGWLEDFWQSLLRILDTGTMAGDIGWGRRILSLAVTVFGILVAGTLIGVIAAGVEDRIDRMRRGRSEVIERNHFVVLGTSDRLPWVVREISLAPEADRPDVVVVLADRDPSDVHRDIRARTEDVPRLRIVVRSGDPTEPSDVRLVRPAAARAVIVLGSDGLGAVRAVLAVRRQLGNAPPMPIVVEVDDATIATKVVQTFGRTVHPVLTAEAVARVAAFALRQPGLGRLVDELIDAPGARIEIVDPGEHPQPSFGEWVESLENARPIGRITSDGAIEINPPPDTRFAATDGVIIVTADGARPTGDALRPDGAPSDQERRPAHSGTDHDVVVLGWSDVGARMLVAWAGGAGSTSTVEIIAGDRHGLSHEVISSIEIASPTIVDDDDPDVTEVCRRHLTGDGTPTFVFLARDDGSSARDTDTRTILDVIVLQREAARLAREVRIIVELLDSDSHHLLDLDGPGDYVISQAIGSKFLAQLAFEPRRRDVLLALAGLDGPGLRLVDASELLVSGPTTLRDLVATGFRRGWLVLGWRDSLTGRLDLAPGLDTSLVVGPSTEFVIVD